MPSAPRLAFFSRLKTRPLAMRTEACDQGRLLRKPDAWEFEKVQILTVEDLFDGKRPHLPWIDPSVFKKAKREKTEHQAELDV